MLSIIAAVADNNVIGKVILKIPQLGQAQFFLLKQGSKLFLILIPAFGVLIYDLIKMLNLFGTKKKVDESLKTKDYKLTKEEEEDLKSSSEDNNSLEDTKEEINSYEDIAKVEEPKKIETTTLEENKESKPTQNTVITSFEKENVYEDGSSSKLEESKKELNSNIKHSNKNNNHNSSKQSTCKTKKTNIQMKKNYGTNNSKKKTTSKKVNNNFKNQRNKQDINVDKVLEKIKEKKY